MGSRRSHLGSQVCPRWDPTWDYGTSRMGSCQLGSLLKFLIASRQSHLGSQVCPRWDPTWDYGTSRLKFLIASHLRRHIPGEIKPRIPPIPLGILPQISDSSYPISLFEAVNMTLKLLIVPSFDSTAPTTFFSFTTLTLF